MDFVSASKLVFQDRKYLFGFIATFFLILGLLVYLPANSTNNRFVTFSLIGTGDLILFGLLAFLTSISLVFNVYLIAQNHSLKSGFHLVSQGGASLISAIFASLFATASCLACATFLFGLIGVSGVFFLIDYRIPITILAILVLITALYFTSQKVLGVCKICKI